MAVATGVLAAALLSVSMSGSLSAFIATINNTTNTASTGALTMSEINTGTGGATCLSTDSTATCSTINKLGGATLAPGGSSTVNITINNTGSVPANTFTLTPSACAQSATGATPAGTANNLCANLTVVITSGATTIFSGTAQALGASSALDLKTLLGGAAIAPGASVPFKFVTTFASTADNTFQNLRASLPLSWQFQS